MKRAAFSLLLALSAAAPARAAASCESIDLTQGWSRETSERFWFASQGSRIMPYAWFLALEVSDPSSQLLFHDPSNFQRYGYVSARPSARNPDGLPIGFAKDKGDGDEHIGLTCAACHTGSLTIGGTTAIVEGGPALADFWTFFADTVDALAAATDDDAKFIRFAKRVLKNDNPPSAALRDLRERMHTKLRDLQERRAENTPTNVFGNGRVDAFGHIFTRVLAQNLGIPENARPPYAPKDAAPVSYPVLWDTPQHDVVQWNGSAPNTRFLDLGSLARNVGEVLGVFGALDIKKTLGVVTFKSSVQPRLDDLVELESIVESLVSPAWPQRCVPLAPDATLRRGREVYEKACRTCHAIIDRTDPRRQIAAVLVPQPSVSTDATMAENYSRRYAKTGALERQINLVDLLQGQVANALFRSEANGRDLLVAVVNGVLLDAGRPVSAIQLLAALKPLDGQRMKKAFSAVQEPRYKARPLNGIWASAPYLHNGSVPNLYALLNPDKRPRTFYVGSREFDPDKVGLKTDNVSGAFLFDTSKTGNASSGHVYGSDLSPAQKADLLEFLKSL